MRDDNYIYFCLAFLGMRNSYGEQRWTTRMCCVIAQISARITIREKSSLRLSFFGEKFRGDRNANLTASAVVH